MNLYLYKRKNGTYNLIEPNHHCCLRTGIPDDEEKIKRSVQYFHAQYGNLTMIARKIKQLGREPNKATTKGRGEYYDKTDLPYAELIEEAKKSYRKDKIKKSAESLRSISRLSDKLKGGHLKSRPKKGKPKSKPKPRKEKVNLKDKLRRIKQSSLK